MTHIWGTRGDGMDGVVDGMDSFNRDSSLQEANRLRFSNKSGELLYAKLLYENLISYYSRCSPRPQEYSSCVDNLKFVEKRLTELESA